MFLRIFNLLLIMTICLLTQITEAQKGNSKYEQQRRKIMEPWKKMFGDKIDFSSEERHALLNSMVAAGVWSLTEFKDMSEEVKRKQWLKDRSEDWMKTFFTEKYRPQVEPLKYYLPKGNERSTLYYQWKIEEYQFTMFETAGGALVEITTSEGKSIRPTPDEFAKLVKLLLNVTIKEDELVKQFKLEGKIEEGDAYTTAPNLKNVSYHDWQKTIIVFGSKRGLCILLLKANPRRASKNLPKDPNWLSEGLIFPDNK